MHDWSEAEKKQSILIDIDIKEYFKFVKKEFTSFKDLITKTDITRSAYYKAESKLLLKKDDLFRQGNISKWEISPEEMKKIERSELLKNREYAYSKMMHKETQHVCMLKQQYAFYSSRLISEYERMRTLNGYRHKDYVMRVSQSHSDILADVNV